MIIPNILALLALASCVYLGYRFLSRYASYRLPLENPEPVFKASLKRLESAGFLINPDAQEADIFSWWKSVLSGYGNPVEALYITLGADARYHRRTNFSDNCWHVDLEAMEGAGSYIRVLENLKRISGGDLDFQNINDYCNDNEDGKAWVSFEFNGEQHKWDLEVDDDFVDLNLFYKVQDLCQTYNKKGRLTYFSEYPGFITSYLTKDEFNKIMQITQLKLHWLNIGVD